MSFPGGNNYPVSGKIITPFYNSKWGEHFALAHTQQGKICGFFEKNFYRCMEAYGQKLGRLYCDLENRDFHECLTHEKMRKRFEAMRMERYKQWLEGRRETPFEKEALKIGQYQPDYYDHVNVKLY